MAAASAGSLLPPPPAGEGGEGEAKNACACRAPSRRASLASLPPQAGEGISARKRLGAQAVIGAVAVSGRPARRSPRRISSPAVAVPGGPRPAVAAVVAAGDSPRAEGEGGGGSRPG